MWLAAETALTSGGQSYTIEDGDMRRTLTRADGRLIVETIASLRSEIVKLERKIASPSRSRIMFGHGVGRGF